MPDHQFPSPSMERPPSIKQNHHLHAGKTTPNIIYEGVGSMHGNDTISGVP